MSTIDIDEMYKSINAIISEFIQKKNYYKILKETALQQKNAVIQFLFCYSRCKFFETRERYIEAHIWTDETINKWLERI